MTDQELAEELRRPITRKFEKRKIHSSFIENISGTALADNAIKDNKGFWFLLCVIDICSKYAWINPLKDKKGITTTNAFQKIFD